MSAPQAAAITACTACAAVGGAAAGGAFSSGSSVEENHTHLNDESDPKTEDSTPQTKVTPEPIWVSLDEEVGQASTYTQGTVGDKYKNLLVGVTGKDSKSNSDWWKKSYDKFKTDQAVGTGKREFSEEFKNTNEKITEAFSSNTATALNKVCDSIYKKQATEVDQDDAAKKKIKADLWRYCSSFEQAPVTVSSKTDENTDSNSIGKAKETELLSTTAAENSKIWIYKNEQFKSLSVKPTEGIFKDKFEASKADSSKLKEACLEAYKKPSSGGDGNPTADNVVKYCSFKKIS